MDKMWRFPSHNTLRFQDFSVPITTVDGKRVTIEGQIQFRFVGESDEKLTLAFARGLGARKYKGKRVGESDEGWVNFLEQMLVPEANSTLKDEFGRVFCADFEPACRAIDPREDIPPAEPEDVYSSVSGTLQERVTEKLGGEYLTDVRLRVNRVTLPTAVQENINSVTEEQAKTKSAEQSIETSRALARSIEIKGRALRKNRGLIALEVAKECKGGEKCTVIVDASGGGVSTSVPTR
jgi:regulator of protease activity HflC (stomatin/prohibitin superfamily)